MPTASDKARLDAFMDRARVYKPALYAFCAKLRAGAYPTVVELGAMLYEAGCDRDEARAEVLRYQEAIEGLEPVDDGFERFMDSLKAFKLPG